MAVHVLGLRVGHPRRPVQAGHQLVRLHRQRRCLRLRHAAQDVHRAARQPGVSRVLSGRGPASPRRRVVGGKRTAPRPTVARFYRRRGHARIPRPQIQRRDLAPEDQGGRGIRARGWGEFPQMDKRLLRIPQQAACQSRPRPTPKQGRLPAHRSSQRRRQMERTHRLAR